VVGRVHARACTWSRPPTLARTSSPSAAKPSNQPYLSAGWSLSFSIQRAKVRVDIEAMLLEAEAGGSPLLLREQLGVLGPEHLRFNTLVEAAMAHEDLEAFGSTGSAQQ